jgi:predicted membrane chloride channel (bestrophin family)
VNFIARFDTVSQELLQRFLRKMMLFAAFATFVSVVQTHGLALTGALLQTQCLVGGGFSIIVAVLLRQRFDAVTLTYWDEAVAFSGVGMLSHIATTIT